MKKVSSEGLFHKRHLIMFLLMALTLLVLFFTLRKVVNFDYISLLIVVTSLFVLFYIKPSIFIKYIYTIFLCVFMLVGVFICENSNIYLSELAIQSGYHGSFALAVIYWYITLLSLYLFDNFFIKKYKYDNNFKKLGNLNKIFNILYPAFFLIGLIMFISVVKYPSFLLNVDRFFYNKTYLSGLLLKMQTYYIYFIPLLLLPIMSNNESINIKSIGKIVISLIPFMLYGIWTGNKFGLFFNIFIILLIPMIVYESKSKGLYSSKDNTISITNSNEIVLRNKIIKMLVAIFTFALCFLLVYYIPRNIKVTDAFYSRTAQQGQLWWKMFEINESGSLHIDELQDELSPLFKAESQEETGYNYGIYKIMKMTTPKTIMENKIKSGSRYSAQGLEISFYYFGYIGLIVHGIMRGFIVALLTNLIIKYLFSYRIIETIIVTRLFSISNFVFTQGDLYLLFAFDTLFTIVLLILLDFLYNKYNKKIDLKKIENIFNKKVLHYEKK